MVYFLKYILAVIFAGFCCMAVSQNQTKRWYFGNYCSLDFATNPPTSQANGAMATWEGCSSVADALGNLLFYTNGVRVWNQSHALMPNGTGLLGENASSQSALIVKQPGSSPLYFIFTASYNGLNYSVVDMSLAAGTGSVTVKNTLLFASSSERLCGTMHCNGRDVWVMSHDMYANTFRAYLLTAAGISNAPVLSSAGSTLFGTNSIGCMKISPNGKKLGMALFSTSSFEVFDFNPATGMVSNALNMPVSAPAYGCEFSPDGSKFYGTLWAPYSVTQRLYQWDLCSGANQAILASGTTIYATHTGQLQLGPDGKIYQARATHENKKLTPELYMEVMLGESMLGVIHNPNAAAASLTLNFNNTGQSVSPAMSMFGLPNFVSGFYKTPVAEFTYSMNPAASCAKLFFSAPALVNATCSATSYTISHVKWLFGDPASGAADSSVLLSPEHTYPAVGPYAVRLILYNACGGVIDTVKQTVEVGDALINTVSSFSICAGGSYTLTAAGASPTYSWSTGASTSSIVVTPGTTTTYSLGYNDAFGCLHRSVQALTVHPVPVITITGKDTLCEGAYTKKTVSGAVSYSWSSGNTNSVLSLTPAATSAYTVTGSSYYGCSTSKTFTVLVLPAPLPLITGDTLICNGAVAKVVASSTPQANYVWNNGVTGPTLSVIPNDMQYVFSVKANYINGCGRSRRVWFNVVPLPWMSIAGPSSVCAGATLALTASGANTYSWTNGITANPLLLQPLSSGLYKVIGKDTNNCVNTATVFVIAKPSSLASASVSGHVSICEGESTVLLAAGGNQYRWEPSVELLEPKNTSVVVSPKVSTVYSVAISTNFECGTVKTVSVLVKPAPKLSAGRDTTFNLNEPVFLTASGTGTITWIGGEGIACADCPHTQIFPVRSTCYQAQAINSYGCMAVDEVCVEAGSEFAVYVPNTFTPNGDGLNDIFFARGFGISNLKISIFDRWGERVFSGANEEEGWDGTVRGTSGETGTYSWILEYTTDKGRWQQKSGHVTLVR